jgi:hypothetical protein
MDATTLEQTWAAVEGAVQDTARFPPGALSAFVDWADVAAGRVEVRRGARVVGVGLLPVSRAAAWLSITDDAPVGARAEGLFEARLEGAGAGPKTLYQHLDLPWPFMDRHWVIAIRTNAALARREPRVWERAWTLDTGALAAARSLDPARWDAAEAVPVNEGGWLLVDAGVAHTLAVYSVRADLGGGVPESAAAAYTSTTLDALFAQVSRNAEDEARRYRGDCRPQRGGDDAPMPCFP